METEVKKIEGFPFYCQELHGNTIFEEDGETVVTSLYEGKCVIVPTFVGWCKAYVDGEDKCIAKSGGMGFVLDFCKVRQHYVCTCHFDTRCILLADFS